MSFTESIDDLVAANESGLLGIHPTWTRVRLADICSILNGFPFSSKQFKPEGGIPIIRIRDVMRGWTETHFVGSFDPTYIVRPGELVVGMDGDFNCALWVGAEALLNQRVCKLLPDERYYDLHLMAHALPAYLSAINSKTSSITVKHLSSRTVAEITLPLPPRQEQKRIVQAIESYLTRLDDAVATLERVQRNLKRYRASVLKAAVEGRLVPTEAELARAEGRDYEPASVLLERILAERRRRWEEAELAKMKAQGKAPKDDKWKARYKDPLAPDTTGLPQLPEGWCWASIEQLASDVRYGSSAKTDPEHQSGTPVLRMGNIVEGLLSFDELKYLPSCHPEFPDLLLDPGDILFNRTNSAELVGKTAVFRGHTSPCSFASYLIRVRCLSGVDPEHVANYLNSLPGRAWIASVVSQQVGQANVNGTKLKACVIPLPPEKEQPRIVAESNRMLSTAFRVTAELRREEARCTRLRQSILKWAFEGRLVDQDPTDEPASSLLERIREERQAKPAHPSNASRRTRATRRGHT